jgi:hypothetical protein
VYDERITTMKRRFSLRFDTKTEKWVLSSDANSKVVKIFTTKEEATRAGVLRKTIGREGGTVRIMTRGGVFEEERNFS